MSSNTKYSISSNPYSANLSDLFKGKSVKLISDPEGYSFAHLLNQRGDTHTLQSESEPLIVLGDILDSTAVGNILKMGNLAELKSHNLDNLLQCRDNPNIHLMFGNRDINKLKLLPLAKIKAPFAKPSSHQSIREFLNPLGDNISYLELANQLQANINNKNWEWEIPDLKHWYPFWKSYKTDDVTKLWKAGRHSPLESGVMSCLERFFLIFGTDNVDGTMSAHNSLYCIPKEVLGDEFSIKFPKFAKKVGTATDIDLKHYKGVITACNKPENSGLIEELDLAAALVLTIYMRMFYPKQVSSNKYIARNSILKYDGLLYDFYTSPRTYFCAYAETLQERLLTFSHGGITKNFLDSKYIEQYNDFFKDDSNYKIMTELSGGYHANVRDGTTTSIITVSIQTFNETYKSMLVEVIHNYLYSKNYANSTNSNKIKANNWVWNKSKKQPATQTTDYKKPTKVFVKFMAMTAPFNSCLHDRLSNCTEDKVATVSSENYSPIMPGILGLRKAENTLYCNDANLVQFIGHSPQGFGATIDLFTNTDKQYKTYNVNLDISNTALTNEFVSDLNKLSDNYFYMVYGTDGKLTTYGKIHVNTKSKGDDNPFIKAGMTEDIITYDSNYDVLGSDFNAMIKFDKQTQSDINMNYWEHGKLESGKFLYTYNGKMMPASFTYNPVLKQPISRGGSRKTKRQSSKKYGRTQTKKLKRK